MAQRKYTVQGHLSGCVSQRRPEKSPLCCQPAGRAEGWQGQKGEAPCRAGLGSLLSSPPSGRIWLCSPDWSRLGNHILEQGSRSLVPVPCSCTGALAVCWECLVQLYAVAWRSDSTVNLVRDLLVESQGLPEVEKTKGAAPPQEVLEPKRHSSSWGKTLPNCRRIWRWAFLLGATCRWWTHYSLLGWPVLLSDLALALAYPGHCWCWHWGNPQWLTTLFLHFRL